MLHKVAACWLIYNVAWSLGATLVESLLVLDERSLAGSVVGN